MVYWTASRNETTSRLFDAYEFSVVDDGWYALGCCHRSTQVRMNKGETMASRPRIRRSSRQQSDREVPPQRPARYQAVVNVLWHRMRGVGVPGTPYITRRGRYQSFPGRGCNSRRLHFLYCNWLYCRDLRTLRTWVSNPPPRESQAASVDRKHLTKNNLNRCSQIGAELIRIPIRGHRRRTPGQYPTTAVV